MIGLMCRVFKRLEDVFSFEKEYSAKISSGGKTLRDHSDALCMNTWAASTLASSTVIRLSLRLHSCNLPPL